MKKNMFWIILGLFLLIFGSIWVGYKVGWEDALDKSWNICASVIELQKDKYKDCKVK